MSTIPNLRKQIGEFTERYDTIPKLSEVVQGDMVFKVFVVHALTIIISYITWRVVEK